LPRNVSAVEKADETVTVRLPYGTAAKVRAATGQPFSTVVRWMVVQLLNSFAEDQNAKEDIREKVQREIGTSLDQR